MRMSRLGIKSQKQRGCEESLSQEILFQSSLLKRHVAGIYGLGNLLVVARNNIIQVIRSVMEQSECVEISLPSLQPKQLWDTSGRWDIFTSSNQMFHLEGRNGQYCLAPTGEEIVIDFIKNNITSYKNLPVNVFQIGSKFRDEIRVRGGLIRSKEFLMKDGYSFHSTYESMVEEYDRMKTAYLEIFTTLGLEVVPVQALNAEMGGNISEEFMFISSIGEDKLLIDEKTNLAFNIEILEHPEILDNLKSKYCNFYVDKLKYQTCIEVGHIFQLGQFYSKKMNAQFIDKDGNRQPYYMGCYGIGINRTLGAICEANCDQEGLVWPKKIAPYVASIIYTENNYQTAQKVYNLLQSSGISSLIDDRQGSIGYKIKDSKLLGIPFVIIIGKNFSNNGYVDVEVRKTGNKEMLDINNLINFFVES